MKSVSTYMQGALCAASIAALGLSGCSDSDAQPPADLTSGAVFAMSNARAGNEVVAYARNDDGSLDFAQRIATGGTGSGSFEDSANGLILATLTGEIAPNNLIEPSAAQQYLLAANPGSNNIAVFTVDSNGLTRTDLEPSNGEKPVSITTNDGLVYVLNSGETNDDLFDAAGDVIPNCTTGNAPSITGFTLSAAGVLTPIAGSTRALSGEMASGCAQVSFSPDGNFLVVTERAAKPAALAQQVDMNERIDDEGVIVVYPVNANGTLGASSLVDATGQGPFGFTFSRNGTLLVTEQFDGPAGVGRGGAASYVFGNDAVGNGPLLRSGPSMQNGGTDTCWIVLTDDQQTGYATSFFQDGRISSYEVDEIGFVRLIHAVASGSDAVNDNVFMGASDLTLSRDSDYLYQLNSVQGTVSAFRTNDDGTLTLIEMETPFPQPAFGPGMGQAAPTGLAGS